MPPTPSPSPALQWPDDRPLDEDGRRRHDDYRLDPVIAALESQLAAWLGKPPRGRAPVPPRIGLFGSLGQGKSTVIGNVLARLSRGRDWRQRWRDRLHGPRIARFDVSFFKADDLEWRFYTAVLWRRVSRNIALLALLVLLGLILLLVLLRGIPNGWRLPRCLADPSGCVAFLRAGVSPLRATLELAATAMFGAAGLALASRIFSGASKAYAAVNPGTGLYIGLRDRAIRGLATAVGALPDIVVIDDLDRAAVEQQRGFLRALSRFSQGLGFALVVCMDESDLLAAGPNPEAPAELLRKTLTVELRVPERTREDVVLLAAVCAREFARANCRWHPELAHSLSSVQFVADLMRALLLSTAAGPIQPRRVWRLLSGVAEQARQLNVTGVDDLSALLRIEGLLQLAPGLRREPDRLRKALEKSRVEDLAALLAGQGVTDVRTQTACTFFQRTRMMQPGVRDGWFRLLGGFGGGEGHDDPDRVWSAAWQMAPRSAGFFRLFIEAVELDAECYPHTLDLQCAGPSTEPVERVFEMRAGDQERFAEEDLPADFYTGTAEYSAQCWALWVCTLVTTTEARRRVEMYHRAMGWIATIPPSHRHIAWDLYWRERAGDEEVWSVLTLSERGRWWHEIRFSDQQSQGILRSLLMRRRLFSIPVKPTEFVYAFALLCTKIEDALLASSQEAAGDHKFDRRSAQFWLNAIEPGIPNSDVELLLDTGFGNHLWPPPRILSPEQIVSQLAAHFRVLRLLYHKTRKAITPEPLLTFFARYQQLLQVSECLGLVLNLAFDPIRCPGQRWNLALPEPWIHAIDGPLAAALQSFLSKPAANALPLPDPASSPAQWAAGAEPQPVAAEHWTALILIAARRDWIPVAPATLIDVAAPDALKELAQTLDDRGELPDWLQPVLA